MSPEGAAPAAGAAGAAAEVVARAGAAGLTVATAESLTAGQVSARLADVPGASAVLRGGVTAYAVDVKSTLLHVDPDLLASHGPVHEDVARQMAVGVRRLLGADLGVATTGVAGPGPADGHPAGTVVVAVADAAGVVVRPLVLPGDRAAVRRAATEAAVALLLTRLP